ncbi:protocatechuate 3,4-dioxygenase subunit alpha [Rhodococcus aerolatus]
MPELTPSQTVGPYLHIGLSWDDGAVVVPADAPGALELAVTVLDGAGDPVPDAMVETWQADAAGRFDHPDDPRGAADPTPPGFRGFGRGEADATGTVRLTTVKPGPLPAEEGRTEAPHVDVSVFARGLLDRVVTRLYFPDEADANATDPLLASLPADRRDRLVATATERGYALTVALQGAAQTPFLAV